MNNTKNYKTDGGDRWVVGGTLELTHEARLVGFPGAENQADSAAATIADLRGDFNALLDKLKAAGLMVNNE